MNERIKQLDLEAAYGIIDPNRESTPEERERFKAKFAELIVRECMELTKQCSTGSSIHDLFADEILAEHFGVEWCAEEKQ